MRFARNIDGHLPPLRNWGVSRLAAVVDDTDLTRPLLGMPDLSMNYRRCRF